MIVSDHIPIGDISDQSFRLNFFQFTFELRSNGIVVNEAFIFMLEELSRSLGFHQEVS